MRARSVSAPTLSARITTLPEVLSVPPVNASPGPFSSGRDSPVIMLSSTAEKPSVTTPSTGTLSPGRTRSLSPGRTASSGTSASPPSPRRRAVRGARPIRARIASPVRSLARVSMTCPASTSTRITAAASK